MKKLLLLTLGAVGLLAAPTANAVTVNELVGKGSSVKESYYMLSNSNQYTFFRTSGTPTFTNQSGRLLIKGALDNSIEMIFTISGSTAQLYLTSEDCWDLKSYLGSNAVGQYFDITGSNWGIIIPLNKSYSFWTTYNGISSARNAMTGTVTESNGHYKIEIKNPFAILIFNNNDQLFSDTVYDGFVFETYSTNATVEETITDWQWDRRAKNQYKANFDFGSDGTVTIDNWGNLGNAYVVNQNTGYQQMTSFKGTWSIEDPNDMYMTVTAGEYGQFVGENASGTSTYMLNYFVGSNWDGKSYLDDIRSSLSYNNLKHSSIWINGRGITTADFTANFQNYSCVVPEITDNITTSYLTNWYLPNKVMRDYTGSIAKIKGIDLTHQVNIENAKMGYGHVNNNDNNYLYIEGDIVPGINSYFVESYELFMIPGAYNSPTGSDFNNTEKGHKNGYSLEGHEFNPGDYFPKSVNVEDNADEDGKIHFERIISENELISQGIKDANTSYSFYVKTNYTSESGLAPSFHALTAFDHTTVGVEDIIISDTDDEDAPVVYYNLNGVQMNGDNLTPGIYVRRQGNTATKVVIK